MATGDLRELRPAALLLGAAMFVAGCSTASDEVPSVVMTTPSAGDTDVDPTLTEIRVEFDLPMVTNSWSWVGGGPTFPETTGEPSFEGDRVVVLPVRLEPEHDYWLSINSDRHTNFVSKGGRSATPYAIEFHTGPWPEGADRPPPTPAPTVVSTTPTTGTEGVDPTLPMITVEFDQPMYTKSWSWTETGGDFPPTRGSPRFTSETVVVLPVRLGPDQHYTLSVNSEEHGNFRGVGGQSAVPYLIEFTTGPWPGGVEPPPLPEIPKVVRTVPDAGSRDVDPGLALITVEFNVPMADGSWSWVGGGESFPGVEGKRPYFETEYIAVLPVRLEPSHDYRLSINSSKHTNFTSREGEPAAPYVFEFTTGAGGPAK